MDRNEFSFKTRDAALRRFREERFDLLVIGGGITGAATARDAASRGLKVALVEKNDFAWGTSSRSSKLIHGGLRYLEHFEWGLVFEALAERALLIKNAPYVVRPLKFYLPLYSGQSKSRAILSAGLWLYDLLALFRASVFHKYLGKKKLLECFPELDEKDLLGGFQYYDATMRDDVLAVETLRSASAMGAVVANYVEAMRPLWEKDRIVGFDLREGEIGEAFKVQAAKTVICAGPWTDIIGKQLNSQWHRWLNPSKGVHLVFDMKRLPVRAGAMVMTHPHDGRIAFVIPRPDFGSGVVIVGTTDGPAADDPEKAGIEKDDVDYLMALVTRYFPEAHLTYRDIWSAYVGVRPLVAAPAAGRGSEGQAVKATAESLQRVSREHVIGKGPGGSIVVAGGKYTTHRRMAREIVNETLKQWKREAQEGKCAPPPNLGRSKTAVPLNPRAMKPHLNVQIPETLYARYGSEAIEILEDAGSAKADPEGFPRLEAQLRHTIRTGMVMHLDDFFLRRIPLYQARADHGLPWAERLAEVWAEERGLGPVEASHEVQRIRAQVENRSAWRRVLEK